MPYIKKELRTKYDLVLDQLSDIDNKGDLEYCVTKLQHIFMKTRDYKYSTLHEAVYAVIHAGDEFRRRFLDKREDSACSENGDIK